MKAILDIERALPRSGPDCFLLSCVSQPGTGKSFFGQNTPKFTKKTITYTTVHHQSKTAKTPHTAKYC